MPTLGCKGYMPGDTELTYIVASLVFCQGQPNGRETCIVLESSPTCSFCNVHTQTSYCNWGMLQTSWDHKRVHAKLCCQMSWCLKRIRMITAIYTSSTDLLSAHYAKNFCKVSPHMEALKKRKHVKIGGWALAQDNIVDKFPPKV